MPPTPSASPSLVLLYSPARPQHFAPSPSLLPLPSLLRLSPGMFSRVFSLSLLKYSSLSLVTLVGRDSVLIASCVCEARGSWPPPYPSLLATPSCGPLYVSSSLRPFGDSPPSISQPSLPPRPHDPFVISPPRTPILNSLAKSGQISLCPSLEAFGVYSTTTITEFHARFTSFFLVHF